MPRARYANPLTHPVTLTTGRMLAPGEAVEVEDSQDFRELAKAGVLVFLDFVDTESESQPDPSTGSLSIGDDSAVGSHSISLGDPPVDDSTDKPATRRTSRRKGGDGS